MQDYPMLGITLIDNNYNNIPNSMLENSNRKIIKKKNKEHIQNKNDTELKCNKYYKNNTSTINYI